MKKIIALVGVMLIAIVGYAVATPYITIDKLKTAAEQKDAETLAENIDFQALRQNFKDQVNAMMMKEMTTTDLKDNPFGVLAIGFASKLVDGMVDSFITPAGISNMMAGAKPTGDETSGSENEQTVEEAFKDAKLSYDSMDKFSAWVTNEKGEELRFVLTRSGLTWKLSNIIMPFEM